MYFQRVIRYYLINITTGFMNTQDLQYSVIIPAYNEAGRIRSLLDSLDDPLAEFIFVCDGTDNTSDVIKKFADNNPELAIEILEYNKRLGKGGGVIEGLIHAKTPVAGFLDADNSTKFADYKRMVHLIGEHDGLIGSRYIKGSVILQKQGILRRILSRCFNFMIRVMFFLPYADTQCGAKIFKTEALKQVLPLMHSRGFEFDVELLWLLKRANFDVVETPVVWNNTEDSRLGSGDTKSMLISMIKLRFGIKNF